MKKFRVPAALLLLAAILTVACSVGRRPFRHLKPEQIVSASVQLMPPDKTLPVPDTGALAELLQTQVVYRRDNSYTEYAGQAVIFTLELTDGTTRQVMAYNPFLVIDGVGWRCEYQPCEALNQYANDLLRNGS
ncbi:hypothetical protein [Dysosmobacter sp.]|uniref:hypothetical protein n=1 Tax=Dysosmobacter sp. TaxID=2591382 RepID=UPI002A8A7DBB|nr:hypothetical protein [Dysosmobacter sp.]MDY3281031.1 hypothetical protein [Dysosmobacter sp.]